jgi:amino acid adenylation domain-containing protein
MDEHIEGFRLSPQQRRLWLRGADGARVSATITVEGDVDEVALRTAVRRTAERHEALRTRFVVPPAGELPVQVIDPVERDDSMISVHSRDGGWQIDINGPALCLDPASCVSLLTEIAAEYEGREPAESPPQYADVAEWFNEQLEGADERQKSHWADRRPTGARTDSGWRRALRRELVLARDLKALAQSLNVEAESIALACWAEVARSTHVRENDLIGVIRDGRFSELESLVGPVEVLAPVRITDLPKAGIAEAARSVAGELREADLSLTALPVDSLLPSVGFRWLPEAKVVCGARACFRLDKIEPHDDQIGALLHVQVDGEYLELEVFCTAELPTPEVLAARTVRLLTSVIGEPTLPMNRHPVLLETEEAQAIARLNPGPATLTTEFVLARVLAHAQDNPDALAAVAADGHLTYGQLAKRSAQIATLLVAAGTHPDDVVAIVSGSSLAWLVAVVGVWRARAACLAIDATVPVGRALSQLEHAGVRIALVAQGWAVPMMKDVEVISLGPDGATEGSTDAAVLQPPDPMGLAFVTFTSGTTGRPKGVAVEHRQLAAYAEAMGNLLELPHGSRLASPASPSVDLGATALLVALYQGATWAVLSTEARLDANLFGEEMRCLGVDVLKITPSHLAVLMNAAGAAVLPRRIVVLGGEQLWPDVVAQVRMLSPGLEIINHYGPTETTIGALVQRIVDSPPPGQPLPIGYALASSYALPGGDGPIPGGRMQAELWLGGPSVARGYVGDPMTTADRFRPDPRAERPGSRAYRTGDLVRLNPQGAAVYVGRDDDQTKVRGVRIEPGEVDRELRALPGVVHAITLAVEDGLGRRLESWVVGNGAKDPASIITALRDLLPEPMVPTQVHTVEAIPITAGGKPDRAALLQMRTETPKNGRPPNGKVEVAIAQCLERLLGTQVKNAHASFFALGGDSLLAIIAMAHLREELGLDLSVETFFRSPSVAGLAELAGPDVVARIEVLIEVARMSDTEVAGELKRRSTS